MSVYVVIYESKDTMQDNLVELVDSLVVSNPFF